MMIAVMLVGVSVGLQNRRREEEGRGGKREEEGRGGKRRRSQRAGQQMIISRAAARLVGSVCANRRSASIAVRRQWPSGAKVLRSQLGVRVRRRRKDAETADGWLSNLGSRPMRRQSSCL